MASLICDKCNNYFITKIAGYNKDKNFLLCMACKKTSSLYTRTFCRTILGITVSKLATLKNLHYYKKPHIYYYDEKDILDAVSASVSNIDELKCNHQEKQEIRNIKTNIAKKERKYFLLNNLKKYGIKYKPFGDMYTFVEYGYPTIDILMENLCNVGKLVACSA